MSTGAVHTAFHDVPREAQSVFRTVMNAMARPGRILNLTLGFSAPAPLYSTTAALLLTLADFETVVWLDDTLRKTPEVSEFIRFHAGAKLVEAPEAASFAVITDIDNAPPLSGFAQGLPNYPDRSATIILQTSELRNDGWQLTGPGIDGKTAFGASPLPADFGEQLKENAARFPLGVDLIFATEAQIAGLPRSTKLSGAD